MALSRAKPGDRSAAEWLIDLVSADADRCLLVSVHDARAVPPDPAPGAVVTARSRASFPRACGAILRRNVANTRRRESKALEWILTTYYLLLTTHYLLLTTYYLLLATYHLLLTTYYLLLTTYYLLLAT